MPSVSAYYTHHENLNKNSFDFMSKDIVGVNLTVPILSSGERMSQLSQAKIQYEQAINNTELTKRSLMLNFEDSQNAFNEALEKLDLDRENLDLSKKVYEQTLIKHKAGVASSSDVAVAQNQFLAAQSTYYMTIIDLVSAKTKLDRALNTLQ